jgi:hypothetical protein
MNKRAGFFFDWVDAAGALLLATVAYALLRWIFADDLDFLRQASQWSGVALVALILATPLLRQRVFGNSKEDPDSDGPFSVLSPLVSILGLLLGGVGLLMFVNTSLMAPPAPTPNPAPLFQPFMLYDEESGVTELNPEALGIKGKIADDLAALLEKQGQRFDHLIKDHDGKLPPGMRGEKPEGAWTRREVEAERRRLSSQWERENHLAQEEFHHHRQGRMRLSAGIGIAGFFMILFARRFSVKENDDHAAL